MIFCWSACSDNSCASYTFTINRDGGTSVVRCCQPICFPVAALSVLANTRDSIPCGWGHASTGGNHFSTFGCAYAFCSHTVALYLGSGRAEYLDKNLEIDTIIAEGSQLGLSIMGCSHCPVVVAKYCLLYWVADTSAA